MTGAPVLVVDDHAQVCQFVAQLLADLGRSTRQASTMAAALAVLHSKDSLGLVICDFQLPDGSGIELAGECGRVRPGLPVLLMSGYDLDGLGVEFIVKPFEPDPFLQKVRSMLAG